MYNCVPKEHGSLISDKSPILFIIYFPSSYKDLMMFLSIQYVLLVLYNQIFAVTKKFFCRSVGCSDSLN